MSLRTGWRADLEPPQAIPADRASLIGPPPSYSMVPWCPPILAQGNHDNCVIHALLHAMTLNKTIRGDYQTQPFGTLSRMQAYYDQRARIGATATDAGGTIADAIAALSDKGAALETSWPYSSPFATQPTASVYAEAAGENLLSTAAVPFNAIAIKNALAASHPVVIGLFLRFSFTQTGSDGLVPMPNANAPVWKNHAVCLVGYGAYPGTFTFANSWGTSWGEDGFGYLPEAVIGNASFSASYYSIIDQD